MANQMANGMAFLQASMKEHMSEPVTLSSGRFGTTGIAATVGRTRQEQVVDGQGSTVQTWITDFMILAADYRLNSEAIEPIAQHVIIRANGTRYKPTPIISGKPPWEWTSDILPTMYRIHAIEVKN